MWHCNRCQPGTGCMAELPRGKSVYHQSRKSGPERASTGCHPPRGWHSGALELLAGVPLLWRESEPGGWLHLRPEKHVLLEDDLVYLHDPDPYQDDDGWWNRIPPMPQTSNGGGRIPSSWIWAIAKCSGQYIRRIYSTLGMGRVWRLPRQWLNTPAWWLGNSSPFVTKHGERSKWSVPSHPAPEPRWHPSQGLRHRCKGGRAD